jgi:hypothetical protein
VSSGEHGANRKAPARRRHIGLRQHRQDVLFLVRHTTRMTVR